jgi:hypothetical protein
VFERDNYQCQACGDESQELGGPAKLRAHHMEYDPDGISPNAMSNLTTLCWGCHIWFHQQTPADAVPITLSKVYQTELTPTDYEILKFLAEHGPASTGEVEAVLTVEFSNTSARERLQKLMGFDNKVSGADRQLIGQDRVTGDWGLPDDIARPTRGHDPDESQTFYQRVEDELVRQALARGVDRQAVMDVFDVCRRTTYHKEKRANAYEFPLNSYRRGGAGGQHPGTASTDDDASGTQSPSADGDQVDGEGDAGEAGHEDASSTLGESGGDTSVAPDASGAIDPAVVQQVTEAVIEQLSD